MKKGWAALRRGFSACAKAFRFLEMNYLIFFTSFIGIFIIVEIVLRIIGIQGSRWIEELSRMMLVTTTLVGSSVAVTTKGHMAMDAITNLVPPRLAAVLEIAVNLLCGAGFLFIAVVSAQWTQKLMVLKRTMESAPAPMWIFWVIITIAFASTGVRFLLRLPGDLKALKTGVREETELKEM